MPVQPHVPVRGRLNSRRTSAFWPCRCLRCNCTVELHTTQREPGARTQMEPILDCTTMTCTLFSAPRRLNLLEEYLDCSHGYCQRLPAGCCETGERNASSPQAAPASACQRLPTLSGTPSRTPRTGPSGLASWLGVEQTELWAGGTEAKCSARQSCTKDPGKPKARRTAKCWLLVQSRQELPPMHDGCHSTDSVPPQHVTFPFTGFVGALVFHPLRCSSATTITGG